MTDKNKQKYSEIYAMMEKGEFESAYVALSKLESKGEPQASYLLGYMHYTGKGAERSQEKAVEHLSISAKKGFIPAIQLLKKFETQAKAPSKDEIDALKAKADTKDPKACYKYAMLLMRGSGVEKNKLAATNYFTVAANNGHFLSILALFNRYAIDLDFEPQWSRAYYWYKKAWLIDKARLEIVHPNVMRGEQLYLAAEDSSLTVEKRVEMLNDAIKEGFKGAYKLLGDISEGETAIDYYQQGASVGDCDAIKALIVAYTEGKNTDPDENNAAFWQNEYDRLAPYIEK